MEEIRSINNFRVIVYANEPRGESLGVQILIYRSLKPSPLGKAIRKTAIYQAKITQRITVAIVTAAAARQRIANVRKYFL